MFLHNFQFDHQNFAEEMDPNLASDKHNKNLISLEVLQKLPKAELHLHLGSFCITLRQTKVQFMIDVMSRKYFTLSDAFCILL
jgi:hypothetical protein